jgi:tetratricopeptide (TPR) repeat protein
MIPILASIVALATAQGPAPSTRPALPLSETRLSPVELAIWQDPAFQKQFARSYQAETEIEPRLTANELKQMQKVLDLISSDQVDKAAALIDKERGEDASAVFDFTLANLHFQRDRLDEAAALYETAVAKFPKFRRAWRNLAMIRVRQKDFKGAIQPLTQVIELGGGDSLTYGLLGASYSSVEDELAAETAFRMAILLDPLTLDWKLGLARSFFNQRRFADAAAIADLMLVNEPDRADLWMLQANAYVGLGQPLRAAQNLELVDRLGKSTVESLNLLGDIYVNQELFDVAVDTYIRAMTMDAGASGPDRSLRAAKVIAARGAIPETRRLVEAIRGSFGDNLPEAQRKEVLKLQSRLAVAAGADDDEARVLREIVDLDPLDGEALILLGQHSAKKGDKEQAIFYFERAAAIDAFEADAKVRHATLLVRDREFDSAIALLKRAQAIRPRDTVQSYLEDVERAARR